MSQPQLRAWPSPLVHLGTRSPPIHLVRVTRMSYGLIFQTLSLLEVPRRRMLTDGLGKATGLLLFYWFSQKSMGAMQDKILRMWSQHSWDEACPLPPGGQLSIIACRTGAALNLHRRHGWRTSFGLNPQFSVQRDRSWQDYPSISLSSFAESELKRADWVM